VHCSDGKWYSPMYACNGNYPQCNEKCEKCSPGAFQCVDKTQCIPPEKVNFWVQNDRELLKVGRFRCYSAKNCCITSKLDKSQQFWVILFSITTELKIAPTELTKLIAHRVRTAPINQRDAMVFFRYFGLRK
jgi:hypothetical protein